MGYFQEIHLYLLEREILAHCVMYLKKEEGEANKSDKYCKNMFMF